MKILIFGGDGMLGHRLWRHLNGRHEVKVTLRRDLPAYMPYRLFSPENAYGSVDVRFQDRLIDVMSDFRPQVVVNAVGIIKQRPEGEEHLPSIEVNALFPHRLARLCRLVGSRLIHISTDCVFSGRKGNYSEQDLPDAEDIYGRTKLLGEVGEPHCLTLRTSMIGPELSRRKSLVEWFLAQRGSVHGFTKAVFSGFTTTELSRVIEKMIIGYPAAYGVYHVSSDPITKFELLQLVRQGLDLAIDILPDENVYCDRSLDSARFRKEYGYIPPGWKDMVVEMCREIAERKGNG